MAGSPLQDNEIENVNNGMKEWKSRRNRAKDKKKLLNGRLQKKGRKKRKGAIKWRAAETRAKEKKRGLTGRLRKKRA